MASTEQDYTDTINALPKCCCCHTWHDTFSRTAINKWGEVDVRRYSFGQVTLNPGDFGYPGLISFSSYTPNGWTISGGKLSCSTAGDGISIGAINQYAADGQSVCFDMTFTGSGKVYYGLQTVFEYDTGRIRLRTDGNNDNKDGYWFSRSLSSGTTYRIRINQRTYGGFEMWIDDEQVWNFAIQLFTGVGNWFFTGSGTLEIDNIDVYTLGQFYNIFAPSEGYPACWPLDPHPFPWLDRGTGLPYDQIQVSYTAMTTFCHVLGFGSPGTGVTAVLDYKPELSNVNTAVYEASGTFGDFGVLRVTLTYPTMTMAFFGGSSGFNPITDGNDGAYSNVVGVPGIRVNHHGDTDTWSWSQGRSQCGVTSCTVSVVEAP